MTEMEKRLLNLYAQGITAAHVHEMLQHGIEALREPVRWLDDLSQHLLDEAEKLGARIVTRMSEEYPAKLLNIPDPPIALYMRGDVGIPMDRVVAAAGSRGITSYGAKVARALGRTCAQNGITMVCGLSEGVDAVAARSCLDAGGKVIGVLVTGIDKVYPSDFSALFERVVENGLLISEFRPKSRPFGPAFDARNRIISGLADTVVLVEARMNSGSMFTVNHALEQGKEVFAVPGNIDSPMSEAPNSIIRLGCNVMTKINDLLEIMGWENSIKKDKEQTEETYSVEEAMIIKALKTESLDYETLVSICRMPPPKLNSLLTRLEMRGIIMQSAGRRYALSGFNHG